MTKLSDRSNKYVEVLSFLNFVKKLRNKHSRVNIYKESLVNILTNNCAGNSKSIFKEEYFGQTNSIQYFFEEIWARQEKYYRPIHQQTTVRL